MEIKLEYASNVTGSDAPEKQGRIEEKKEMFTLTGLPMAPSSNHQYWYQLMKTKAGKTAARPTPTSELKAFDKAIKETWKNSGENLVALYKCRAMLRGWMLKGLYIRVETLAFFPYFELFTKEGLPRRMDGTNRLKALHDCMAELLEIDDSWFWDAEVRKRVTKRETPWCVMRFFPVENLTLEQMKERGLI